MQNSTEKIRIALAGNPNCGKTTVFNALTGSNQHVGNYSGVTVEKRDGSFIGNRLFVTVSDLPGTYSLNHHSPEERIAQEELLGGDVDLLVAIVDSGSLSRSLIFVAQLMQLNLPMILCLNMWDEAEKAGLDINVDAMRALLGMPVIKTVASKGIGIDELKNTIVDKSKWQIPAKRLRLGSTLGEAVATLSESVKDIYPAHQAWAATKLLLGDAKYSEEIAKSDNGRRILSLAEEKRKHIEKDTAMDIRLYVTEQYYGFVDGLLKEVTRQHQRADARALSDRIDKVLVNKYAGVPIFLLIVYLLFEVTFTVGQYPMDWIEAGFAALGESIGNLWPEGTMEGVKSLLIDGIIGGVGGVIVFLPNILILFLGISFLEDSGYMARSAFIMDKIMHKVGLHGRSFIPLITGFGCTIPALMATRTIAGEKERLTTMFILPLMSCGARLPIWLLLVPIFFAPSWHAPVLFAIYLTGILIALFGAFLLRHTLFKGSEEPFVMELPPYRMPTLRATLTHMFERAWLYLKKAGTIILAVSIILWALTSYPKMDEKQAEAKEAQISSELREQHPELYAAFLAEQAKNAEDAQDNKVEEAAEAEAEAEEETEEESYASMLENRVAEAELEHSFAGRIGKLMEPIVKPMGFDWKISVALIGAVAAKEVFVAQMGIVYSLGETDETSESLKSAIRNDYSTLTGICLIIFLLISAPCMATVAVMRRETGSTKYALAQFGGLTLLAYLLATIVQQIGQFFT